MHKQDLALNDLQELIYHKTQEPNNLDILHGIKVQIFDVTVFCADGINLSYLTI